MAVHVDYTPSGRWYAAPDQQIVYWAAVAGRDAAGDWDPPERSRSAARGAIEDMVRVLAPEPAVLFDPESSEEQQARRLGYIHHQDRRCILLDAAAELAGLPHSPDGAPAGGPRRRWPAGAVARVVVDGASAAAALHRVAAFASAVPERAAVNPVWVVRRAGGLEAVWSDEHQSIAEPLDAEDPDSDGFAGWPDLAVSVADAVWMSETHGFARDGVEFTYRGGAAFRVVSADGETAFPVFSAAPEPDACGPAPPDPGPGCVQAFLARDLLEHARESAMNAHFAPVVIARDAGSRQAAIGLLWGRAEIACRPSPVPVRVAFRSEHLAAAVAAVAADGGVLEMFGPGGSRRGDNPAPWAVRPRNRPQRQLLAPVALEGEYADRADWHAAAAKQHGDQIHRLSES